MDFPGKSIIFYKKKLKRIESVATPDIPKEEAMRKIRSDKGLMRARKEKRPLAPVVVVAQQRGSKFDGRQKKALDPEAPKPIYKCPHCSHQVRDKNSLISHISTHSTELPFKCNICDRAFRHLHRLKNHQRKMHIDVFGNLPEDGYKKEVKEQPSEVKETIDKKPSEFKTVHDLLVKEGDKAYYKCHMCPKICYKPHEMRGHLGMHTKASEAYKSFEANFKAKSTPVQYMHLITKTEDKFVFQCDQCEKRTECAELNTTFRTTCRDHIRRHILRTAFKCPQCDATASSRCVQ